MMPTCTFSFTYEVKGGGGGLEISYSGCGSMVVA